MKKHRLSIVVAALSLALLAAPTSVVAADYAVDPAQSVFAVLTHKVGVGSSLAHDHLVVASKPTVRLDFDPAAPEATKIAFTTAIESLEVDGAKARATWAPRFKALGIHSGELAPIADGDRAKIREAMLGASQLDAAKFPEVKAELVSLQKRDAPAKEAAWNAKLRVTIHGKTVERTLPVTWTESSGTVKAELVGAFKFSEFGIEPYSAMLGAIRNDDLFHIYASVVARPR